MVLDQCCETSRSRGSKLQESFQADQALRLEAKVQEADQEADQKKQQKASIAVSTAKVESIADEDAASDNWGGPAWSESCFQTVDNPWTAEQDTRLLKMRREEWMGWDYIATTLDKSAKDCMHRFAQLIASNTSNTSGTESSTQASNPGRDTGTPEMDLKETYALFKICSESERREVDPSILRSQMAIAPQNELAKLEKAFE